MNTPSSAPERRRWSATRWLLLVLALTLTPVVALVLTARSFVTLDADAAVLREGVVAATHSSYQTKVQLSVGRATLGMAQAVLRLVDDEHAAEARLALRALRRASVGVYERRGRAGEPAADALFLDTDRTMQARNWTRLVGVEDGGRTVLIYTSNARTNDEAIDLCLAVVDGRQLVVVSTSIQPDALMPLIEQHLPKPNLRHKLASR